MKVDWANLPLSDVTLLATRAAELVAAHERRSPTSQRATLGEADALFNLRFAIRQIEAKDST